MKPLLVLVSGKPGSGKSTLARRLADEDALWLPLISRDALKIGLSEPLGNAEAPTEIVLASIGVFYGVVEHLLRASVSLIAEQSFRRGISERDLYPLKPLARTVNVHCQVCQEEAKRRFGEREGFGRSRRHPVGVARKEISQMERGTFDWTVFEPLDLGVPTLRVDTTRGYAPDLAAIVDFCLANG